MWLMSDSIWPVQVVCKGVGLQIQDAILKLPENILDLIGHNKNPMFTHSKLQLLNLQFNWIVDHNRDALCSLKCNNLNWNCVHLCMSWIVAVAVLFTGNTYITIPIKINVICVRCYVLAKFSSVVSPGQLLPGIKEDLIAPPPQGNKFN